MSSHPRAASNGTHLPTLRELTLVEQPVAIKVSPSGQRCAVNVRTTNWRDNRYETLCRVGSLADGRVLPLNRAGNVLAAEWVNDDTLALLKRRGGEHVKPQIWLYEGLCGDGWAVTDHRSGVDAFYPFAGGFVFLGKDFEREENKARTERFGRYTHFEQQPSSSALYYVGVAAMREYQARLRTASEDEARLLVKPVVELSVLLDARLSIRSFLVSPMGDALYLTCWPHDDLVYRRVPQTYRLRLDVRAALAEHSVHERAKKARRKSARGAHESDADDVPARRDPPSWGSLQRLKLPAGATVEAVSPDGRELLVLHRTDGDKLYLRADLWILGLEAALAASDSVKVEQMQNVSASLDRDVLQVYWVERGIFASYIDGVTRRVARFERNGVVAPLAVEGHDGEATVIDFHVSANGAFGVIGASSRSYAEAYLGAPVEGTSCAPARLTELGRAIESWELGTVETIRWTSKDGTSIEGVLRKPRDFDPNRRYPLVFIVHGGPRWHANSMLLFGEDLGYYPAVQLAARGMLVLKPNYRGSLGYGQAFTALNVGNLGVGDLWDLESAIDHLVQLGWVDPERVGCMGWSQGGYISAFAGLHSQRFKAVSVGAGISDWYTYHISNDVPDFTLDYLLGSPFRGRERYERTSPMANISHARTPTLLQHGSDDRRVPLSNATELYRGLKEMGVPVELFVFPGMGHPITKPRENHAVMHQNLAWFAHHLLGDELKLE
jgi:dipeptidyl aminopeptidase/acylaminoacyl peptidase